MALELGEQISPQIRVYVLSEDMESGGDKCWGPRPGAEACVVSWDVPTPGTVNSSLNSIHGEKG